MPSKPDLRRTQGLFWDLITAPTGAGPGAEALAAAGKIDSADLGFLVRRDERLGPADRLNIYADMYFYRLRDSLAEDYPKVAAVLGGAAFHNLVTDYLLVHPSSFWSLRELGRALPAYLEGHAEGAERPWLADLARLEWARIDVFDEADAATLSREAIASLPPEAAADLALRLVPACRILSLGWNIAPVWRALEDREAGHEPGAIHSASVEACEHGTAPAEVAPPENRPSFLRVWRKGQAVLHRAIRSDEHACLAEMQGGASLARVGEIVVERGAGDASDAWEAGRRVAVLLQAWLEDGILGA